jgi:hypothetical protein
LQVELIYLQSVAVGMPALLGGDFQILAGGVAAYLSAASRGAKLILFGTAEENPKAKEINIDEVLDNSFVQRQVDNGFIDRLYSPKRDGP